MQLEQKILAIGQQKNQTVSLLGVDNFWKDLFHRKTNDLRPTNELGTNSFTKDVPINALTYFKYYSHCKLKLRIFLTCWAR